jgi:hypothetical protein
MSHKATNWAIEQRGLKPAVKLVLWHLADRHHPDHGCFPSQDTLAEDCEVSRSSLNNHLNELEARGLIRRIQRSDKATHRQKSTLYLLGFELEGGDEGGENGRAKKPRKSGKPCPENGHGAVSKKTRKPCPKNAKSRVQNLDTNPVREPVKNQRARGEVQFFTADERFEAEQIADHIRGGGTVNPTGVSDRALAAIRTFELLSEDEISKARLGEEGQDDEQQ